MCVIIQWDTSSGDMEEQLQAALPGIILKLSLSFLFDISALSELSSKLFFLLDINFLSVTIGQWVERWVCVLTNHMHVK